MIAEELELKGLTEIGRGDQGEHNVLMTQTAVSKPQEVKK